MTLPADPLRLALKTRLLKAAAFYNAQALAAKEPVRAEWERHAQTVWDAANALPSSSPGWQARLIVEWRERLVSLMNRGAAIELKHCIDDLAALSDARPSSPVAPERCVCGGEIVAYPYCVRCGNGRVAETRSERVNVAPSSQGSGTPLVRNMSTPESRAFWTFVAKTAAEWREQEPEWSRKLRAGTAPPTPEAGEPND